MLVTERLELAVGPGVQNPILDIDPCVLRLILSLVPGAFDLLDERVLALFGTLLDLDALLLQIIGKRGRVPAVVGLDNVVVPIALDKLLELPAVCGGGIRDIMVR